MSDVSQDVGYVYVLTNEAMPRLVKIGITGRDDVSDRVNELSRDTGVPIPFTCAYACKVKDYKQVEKALHDAFKPYRVPSGKEFFYIEVDQAKAILKLLAIESDVTDKIAEEVEKSLSAEDKNAREFYMRKAPTMKLSEMGIPPGAKLSYNKDPSVEVEVCDGRNVIYNGEQMSLSLVTRKLLNVTWGLRPVDYWSYDGKALKEIYDDTYM